MAPAIVPVHHATFDLTTRLTTTGRLMWRAACDVPDCPAYVEAVDQADVVADAVDHQAAHIRGAHRLEAVAAATIRKAA